MLQKLHENIKGWIASVVIGLLCFTFVLWGVQYYVNNDGVQGKVLAKVGNIRITEAQVAKFSRQLQRQVTQRGDVLNEQFSQQLRQVALRNLIAQAALSSAAQRSGFAVTEQQVQKVVESTPAFQQDGDFSAQKFQQFLYNAQLSQSQFLEKFQKELLISQAQMGVEATNFVLPFELSAYYYLTHQQRSFSYLVVPVKKFSKKVTVTQAEIKTYYDNNKEQFRTPEKLSIEYIALSPDQLAKTVAIDTSAAKQYYETHQDSYRENKSLKPFNTVKKEIIAYLRQQKVQQKMAAMSDDLTDLSFTNPDSLGPAAKALGVNLHQSTFFDRTGTKTGIASHAAVVMAAFSDSVLHQGNNSDPIVLKDGQVIVLRVKSNQPSEIPALSSVQKQVREHLMKQTQEAKASLLASQLETQLISGTSPKKVAQKNHLQWVTKNNVQRDDKKIPEAILSAAFDLLLQKPNSITTVALANGDTAVLRLRKITHLHFDKASEEKQQEFQEKMQRLLGDISYGLYVNAVKEDTHISLRAA